MITILLFLGLTNFTLILVAIIIAIVAIILLRNYRSIPKGKLHTFRDILRYHEPYEAITTRNRGTASERWIVSKLLRYGLKPTAVYHDLLVTKTDAKYSQIDIVVATDVGLIVVEVKDYSGWIFGNGNQENWMQITRYGKGRHKFYNPFKQNQGHINALRSLSAQMKNLPMYSLVVFCGNCTLKDVSFVPQGCYLTTGRKFIKAFDDIIKSNLPTNYSDKWEVARLLQQAVNDGGNKSLQTQHIIDIHNMLVTSRYYN